MSDRRRRESFGRYVCQIVLCGKKFDAGGDPAENKKRIKPEERPVEKPVSSQDFPFIVHEEKGTRLWCACGRSAGQPYCDGSHKGTGLEPVSVEVEGKVLWCGCRRSAKGHLCDGSHNR